MFPVMAFGVATIAVLHSFVVFIQTNNRVDFALQLTTNILHPLIIPLDFGLPMLYFCLEPDTFVHCLLPLNSATFL